MAEAEAIPAAVLLGIPHGFLTRRGGYSTGAIAGLNVGFGSGEDRDTVERNRKLAAEAVLPGAQLVSVHQVHSSECAIVAAPWDDCDRPNADALATDRPGLLLGIVTADCAPILLADKEAGIIGAAHAGWRGALGGVGETVIAAMESLGACRERIVAAIGPAIAQGSYEVGADFRANFGSEDGLFFETGRPGHFQFNLEAYLASRLEEAGITEIECLGLDTYADEERFYSYRRATHRGEPDYGRQFSLIGLPRPS